MMKMRRVLLLGAMGTLSLKGHAGSVHSKGKADTGFEEAPRSNLPVGYDKEVPSEGAHLAKSVCVLKTVYKENRADVAKLSSGSFFKGLGFVTVAHALPSSGKLTACQIYCHGGWTYTCPAKTSFSISKVTDAAILKVPHEKLKLKNAPKQLTPFIGNVDEQWRFIKGAVCALFGSGGKLFRQTNPKSKNSPFKHIATDVARSLRVHSRSAYTLVGSHKPYLGFELFPRTGYAATDVSLGDSGGPVVCWHSGRNDYRVVALNMGVSGNGYASSVNELSLAGSALFSRFSYASPVYPLSKVK